MNTIIIHIVSEVKTGTIPSFTGIHPALYAQRMYIKNPIVICIDNFMGRERFSFSYIKEGRVKPIPVIIEQRECVIYSVDVNDKIAFACEKIAKNNPKITFIVQPVIIPHNVNFIIFFILSPYKFNFVLKFFKYFLDK